MSSIGIGRQLFSKFLRKNALLFSSPPPAPVQATGSQNQGQAHPPPQLRSSILNSTKFLESNQFKVQQNQQQSSQEEQQRKITTAFIEESGFPPERKKTSLSSTVLMSLDMKGLQEPVKNEIGITLPYLNPFPSPLNNNYHHHHHHHDHRIPLCGTSTNNFLSHGGVVNYGILSKDCLSNAYMNTPMRGKSCKRHVHTLNISELNEDGKVLEKVTLVEMKRFFRKHEIPFVDGYTCLRVDCFFCKKGSKKKKTFPWESDKLFVNKTTGYFVCINCKITGTWRNLQDLVILSKSGQGLNKAALDLLKKDEPSFKHEDKLNDLQMNSKEISTFTDEEWNEIARRFGIEKLKRLVLEHYEMRHNGEEDKLLLPIYSVELKRVGYLVLKKSTKTGDLEAVTVPKNCTESFGWKPILQSLSTTSLSTKSKPIVLVQSALDVLAVASGSSYLPLGLHPGCNYLPQEFLPKLENFDEILLWFGNDVKSWETAKAFGRKLEERRCRLIRPIDLHPAPFLALLEDMNFNKILSGAQLMEHKAITTFSKLREEVFSELSHQEKVAGVKWTRYPYLNKLLKGHRRGELTILTGSTGCGKTTFMSEYSLDLSVQGVNTLWGSFEIRNVRLAKTMLTQYSEIDLEKHIEEYDKWADKFEKLPLYFMTFHGQQSIKAVLDAMTHAAYVYDIGHVIVDNLQFMLGVSDEKGGHFDRYWRQDLIVAAFRKFATVNNCHVTLVMHPRKEGNDTELSNSSIFGGAKASQEADNILILQDKRLTSPRGKKYLQVTKNRFSGDLGMFTLEFNRDCLSFATKKKPKTEQSTIGKQKNDENIDDSTDSSLIKVIDDSNISSVQQ